MLNSFQTSATITGTPTTRGTYVFDVSAFDPQYEQTVVHTYSITVVTGLSITTPPTLSNATVGANYSVTLRATGGTPPYTWFIQSDSPGVRRRSDSAALPGVSLTSAGVLSGTPTQTGTFAISVGVNDSDQVNPQSDFRAFSVTVSPAPTVASGALPGGTVGAPYVTKLGVTGGSAPFTWTITQGSLPQGVALFASGSHFRHAHTGRALYFHSGRAGYLGSLGIGKFYADDRWKVGHHHFATAPERRRGFSI